MTCSKTSISGWKMFAETSICQALGAAARGLEQALILDWIESPGTPRVAAQQPPAGQDKSAEYAESGDRLRGVLRARRVVLAALPHDRREQSLVEPDRQRPRPRAAPSRRRSSPRRRRQRVCRRRSRKQFAQRTGDPVETLTLGESPSVGARDDHGVGSRRAARPLSSANASRSSRLTRLRSTAPPTLRDTDSPSRGGSTSSPRGNTYSTSSLPACERPFRKTRSKSALRDSRPSRRPGTATDGARSRTAHQTVRRLRPLSRRRFSVSRPARVRIRARKPCVRARLRFFG